VNRDFFSVTAVAGATTAGIIAFWTTVVDSTATKDGGCVLPGTQDAYMIDHLATAGVIAGGIGIAAALVATWLRHRVGLAVPMLVLGALAGGWAFLVAFGNAISCLN